MANYLLKSAKRHRIGFMIGGMGNEVLDSTGLRVQFLREQKRWTQKELGSRVDVGAVYINQIENGKRRASRALMKRLAQELGTSVGFLEMEIDDPTPPHVERPPVYFSAEADEIARLVDGMHSELARALSLDVVTLIAARCGQQGGGGGSDDSEPPLVPGTGTDWVLGRRKMLQQR